MRTDEEIEFLKRKMQSLEKEVEILKGKVCILELNLKTHQKDIATEGYRNFVNSPDLRESI